MKIIIKTNSLLHEDYGQDYLTYNKTFSIIVAKVIVNTLYNAKISYLTYNQHYLLIYRFFSLSL